MRSSYKTGSDGTPTIDKDPSASLDYSVDWSKWLAYLSDTIATLSVTVSGVTLVSSAVQGSVTTAWITGGTIGASATAKFSITTSGGRTDSRTIGFNIKVR